MTLPRELALTRRDLIKLGAGAFVLAGFPILQRQRRLLLKRSINVMGTTAELGAIHHSESIAQRALDAAANELKRLERLMTRFDHNSEIGRINALAGLDRVNVSQETAYVTANAINWANATRGAFDPALARMVDLWDVTHRSAPPPPASVQRLAGRHLYRRIDIDDDRRAASIMIVEPDAALDLGGIAAGYAVDRAVQVLREHRIEDGFVNVSGDIYVLGVSHDKEPWQIGIRSPVDPAALIGEVALSNAAIATSGDYEQGFNYGGRRYHHIMDPGTGAPRITSVHSLTIRADSCMEADAATTALFGWAHADAARVLAARTSNARIVDTA